MLQKRGQPPTAPVNGGQANNPGKVMGAGVGVDRKRIGELMVEAGAISKGQLKEALDVQAKRGGKLVEILIALQYLSVEGFIKFLAKQPGVASIDLAHYQIPDEIVALIPKEIAIKHEVFPIDKMGKLLTIGMACPLDSKTMKDIEAVTGLRVKALLCSQADIRKAIRRYYPLEEGDYDEVAPLRDGQQVSVSAGYSPKKIESGLRLGRVSKLIQGLESLPALPMTVEKVQRSMHDMSISPKDVADTIVKDPPVAAKVLSVANSAAYGFPNRVGSVDLAVALMGLRETYSIVLSAAVLNLFEKSKHFNYKSYWEESMNSAAAAKILAKHAGREREGSIFTAGLLHDIGRIALLETMPEAYGSISADLDGDDLIQAEEVTLGVTHAEAGFELATKWNLPQEIAEPIRFHHHPHFAVSNPIYVAIVALSEQWVRARALNAEHKQAILEKSSKLFDIIGMAAGPRSAAYDEVASLERVRFEWKKA